MPEDVTAVATRLGVKPISPRIGAVISGVNLAESLSDEVLSEIRNALLAHRVVFFREQQLDADHHVGFAQRLGPVTLPHPTLPSSKKNAALFDLDSQAGAAANHWHTDVTRPTSDDSRCAPHRTRRTRKRRNPGQCHGLLPRFLKKVSI